MKERLSNFSGGIYVFISEIMDGKKVGRWMLSSRTIILLRRHEAVIKSSLSLYCASSVKGNLNFTAICSILLFDCFILHASYTFLYHPPQAVLRGLYWYINQMTRCISSVRKTHPGALQRPKFEPACRQAGLIYKGFIENLLGQKVIFDMPSIGFNEDPDIVSVFKKFE